MHIKMNPDEYMPGLVAGGIIAVILAIILWGVYITIYIEGPNHEKYCNILSAQIKSSDVALKSYTESCQH